MSMSMGARQSLASEMNVTPLIDVLLVLLIIFMVILPPHSQGESAQIPQPSTDKTVLSPQEPVVIQLKDVGDAKRPELRINQDPVRWEDLDARLKAVYHVRSERIAFVKGDPEVEFAFVAEAVDMTHRAGAERVGLLP